MEPEIVSQPMRICCSGNCPTITVEPNEVVIRDDYDGSIKLTPDEFEALYQKYTQIKNLAQADE